jgi:putative membrane-bound dehydrogenase-like protein
MNIRLGHFSAAVLALAPFFLPSLSLSIARAAAGDPPADVVAFAGLSPREAASKAALPPGFAMHVFAAEPDLVQPIAFCLDHRGRVWVAEGVTYPKRKGQPPREERPASEDRSKPTAGQLADIFGGGDRILVFEDTDGDHKFDRRTVFLEKVNLISGLEVGFGGVWIGAAPYLMFVPVADWDNPKPAGPPQILLDGWNYSADTHETLNTFTWGPDGWLYGCHGVFCPSYVGTTGTNSAERQWCDAAVWRYHPTRQKFEIFTEGGSNPWGIDFDERGQLFAEMCVIPHFWHMIQGARIERQGGQHYPIDAEETRRYSTGKGKPVHPHIYEDIKQHGDHVHWAGNRGPHAANARSDAAGGGHAHAGVLCYLGESWPAEYRGNLLIGNIHGQRVNVDIPVPEGSGYVGKHGADFVNFNDTWSQTLNQRYDQDGSVYIIDWYDKNQCHHNREDGHDRGNGRIYKIVYKDQKVTPINFARFTDTELVKLVPSRNEFLSRGARKALQERLGPAEQEFNAMFTRLGELKQDVQSKKLPASALEEYQQSAPVRKLKEIDGRVRQVSSALNQAMAANPSTEAQLRLMWAKHLLPDILDSSWLDRGLKAKDPVVRGWAIQLAAERGRLDGPKLAALAAGADTPWVRRYVASAVQRLKPADRRETLHALLSHAEDATDHNLPLMYWFALDPIAADQPAEALTAALATKLPRLLNFTARRIASLGTTAARDLLAGRLATLEQPAQQRDILAGLSAALKGQRNVPMPAGWTALETKLAKSDDAEIRTVSQTLSLIFGSKAALAALRATLADAKAPLASRRAALDSLVDVRDGELPPVLTALLDDRDLRGAAIRALAGFPNAGTADALIAAYANLDAAQKRDALNTLVSRPAFARPLLAAVDLMRIPRADLTADIVRQLRGMKEPAVQELMAKLYGRFRESSADKKAEIEKYRRVYAAGGSQPGNASAGRVVFNRVCAQCHTLFDSGGKVGPDITGANRADLTYLLETIVDPNAVIPNEYRTTEIETKDGRSLTGIQKAGTDKTVLLQTANELSVLATDDIASQRLTELSMMPEELLAPLADQEVRDLIYYLTRTGQVPLPGGASK